MSVSALEGPGLSRLHDEVLHRPLVQLGEGLCLRDGGHVVQAEPEAELLQLPGLVLDGGGIEHGHVVHGDSLPDDPLTPSLQLLLTVTVGEVQQSDGVLWRKVHLVHGYLLCQFGNKLINPIAISDSDIANFVFR